MINIIIGQCYLEKQTKEIKTMLGKSSLLSEYTTKVYNTLLTFLLEQSKDIQIDENNSFLINEIILDISLINEEENEEEKYITIEDFLKEEKYYLNISNIDFKFYSQIKDINKEDHLKKLIQIFRISTLNDFIDILKTEKNIDIDINF